MKKLSLLKMFCMAFVFCAATAIASPAQVFNTLHSFAGYPSDGANPGAGLVQASDGNFYGTTGSGGAGNWGTVFKIAPSGTVTILHSFGDRDGEGPAGLVQATDGNFYGTTNGGGTNLQGTVFKITPGGTLTTLYNFCSQSGCADGQWPLAGLVQATDGNFYGTTYFGGAHGAGTVFKITSSGTLTTLYSFCPQNNCPDGGEPDAGLVQATDGNFYGTTVGGGAYNAGTIFKITPGGMLTTLYSFCSQSDCSDGEQPVAGLVQASDRNFYGTTHIGGANYAGTVFKITPSGTLTTLYSFCSQTNCSDGANPWAGLVQATDGNFYGTARSGGNNNDCVDSTCGTMFKITPSGTLTTLYSFCSQTNCSDGANPGAGVVQATDGNFYGTTGYAGAYGGGTVFRLVSVRACFSCPLVWK